MPTIAPRASRWDWAQALLLALNLAATTLALGGYLRETLLWSSAVTAVIVALKLARGAWVRAGGRDGPRWHAAGWWLVPFLGYAAINVIWVTPVGSLGWRDWLGWTQLAATFWLALDVAALPGPRRLVRGTVIALGVVLVGLGCYQRFVDPRWMMFGRTQSEYFMGRASGAFGIPNSMAAFLVLLIPSALAAAWWPGIPRAGRLAAGAIAGWWILGLVLTVSRGPWLALAVALSGWPLLRRGKTWRWRWGTMAGALVGMLAVGTLLYAALPGVRARVDRLAEDRGEKTRPIVWRAAWKLWREAPLVGTGAGSYNVLFERHRPERFWDEPQWAHNDYLNTLSDYGAVGFILGFGGMAGIGWAAVRRSRSAPPTESPVMALAVGLGAFALGLLVDFHLKLPALAMVVALVAAEAVAAVWPRSPPQGKRISASERVLLMIGAVLLLGVSGGWILPQSRAEARRNEARRKIDRLALRPVSAAAELAILTGVRADLTRAVMMDGGNAQAWSDVAYAAVLIGRLDSTRAAGLGIEAERAARRALAQSSVVAEFWWRLGVALDMQGRWAEGGEAFARGVALAPNLPQAWFYMAYHFSLNPVTRPMALTAVATCLRLDPWFRDAEALRDQLKSPH
ncbi:MAG: O-antigen ligase family protein [Undibacterium sp.]|nr:O-antigen ligase family protein [Opitutaceae bacterium]